MKIIFDTSKSVLKDLSEVALVAGITNINLEVGLVGLREFSDH